MSTLDNALRALLKMNQELIKSYEKTNSDGTWIVEKYRDGTLIMRLKGLKTVTLNYVANAPFYFGTYILTFPEKSITPALVNCTVFDNNGATFQYTTTEKDNMSSAHMIFCRGSAATALRTQHNIEIIGTWK